VPNADVVVKAIDFNNQHYVDIRKIFRSFDKTGTPVLNNRECQKFAHSQKGICMEMKDAKKVHEIIGRVLISCQQT
jgi:hypothetical protein